jgi:tetratricopeptide (TPR) repeat protein
VMIAAVLALTLVHHTVTTSQPSAQSDFNHGLLLYYAYAGDDAEGVFASAARRDPSLAMAYWGEALAAGPDFNTPLTADRFARGHLAIGRALALTRTSADERAYIAAMAQRFAGNFEDAARDERTYRTAMNALADSAPSDDDAALLAAEAELEDNGADWKPDGTPAPATARELALVNRVLLRNAMHPMANHLCVHIYDTAPDRAPAIACARHLDAMTFEPAAHHLPHMPAHTWAETGHYRDAIASSERAFALVAKYRTMHALDNATPAPYELHDDFVALDAAAYLGSFATALRWERRLVQRSPFTLESAILARFARWKELAALPSSSSDTTRSFADVLAAAARGDLTAAHGALEAFRREVPAPDRIEIAQARIDERDGRIDEAIAQLRQAVTYQTQMYLGENLPLFPADELIGGVLLRAGRYADAEAAFRNALVRFPDDPRALYGLAQTLQREGRTGDAQAANRRFTDQWRGADTVLTIRDL